MMTRFNSLLTRLSNNLELSHAYGMPIHAQIEITTYCNSKCVMCNRKAILSGTMPSHMCFDEFNTIIQKLPYCKVICIHGLGEPLLNPDIVKIVKLCKERRIKVGFTTNASVLTETMGKKLILSGLDSIEFSIDCADAKTFERLRKGTNFAKSINNIRRFIRLKNKLKSSNPFIGAKTVVSDKNIMNIPKLLKLLSCIGIKNVLLRDVMRNPSLKSVNKRQLNLLQRYKSLGESLGLRVSLLFPGLPPLNQRKSIKCWKLWKSVYITVDGHVTPCCFFPEGRRLNFGNILKQDFKDVWNCRKYQLLRKKIKDSDICYPCKKCIWTQKT